MRRFAFTAILAGAMLTGCTNNDRYGTRERTGEANREIQKDAKEASAKLKEGWQKTKAEVKDGVEKLKDETNKAVDSTKDAGHDTKRSVERHTR